jgi:hypothetical protein
MENRIAKYKINDILELKSFYGNLPAGTKGVVVKIREDSIGFMYILYHGNNLTNQQLKNPVPEDVLEINHLYKPRENVCEGEAAFEPVAMFNIK